MRIEYHPSNYPIQEYFPEQQLLSKFEGGCLWLAEKDGYYYVIVDEGTMADFLIPGEDDDLLNKLVENCEFDSDVERKQFIQEKRWTRRKK